MQRGGNRRHGWLGLVVGIALGAAVLAPPALAAPSGTAAWRDRGATRTGSFSARRMSVALVLHWRHAAALENLVAHSRPRLSPARFRSRYAPSAATLAAVRRWARAHDLTAAVSANRVLITLTGSSAHIARALGTSFASFHSPSQGSFHAITRAARLPHGFASAVTAVVGLSSLDRVAVPHPAARSAADLQAGAHGAATLLSKLGVAPPNLKLPVGIPVQRAGAAVAAALPSLNYPAQYTPQQLNAMYDAPSGQTGSGQQLSIIAEGDVSQPKKDLATFESDYKLPAVTWNQINVGTPSSDTSGDDEWDLDSQYSTAFAPGVSTLNVYVAPSMNDSDILTTINRWVTDDRSRQGSFSAGECDLLAYVSGFTSGLDTVLEQAAAQGQTLFSSSGDTGSQCPAVTGVNGLPVGIPDTNYPASSPYGIGVGGTTVLSNNPLTEIAWYAGGGGFSPLESTPAFQAGTKAYGIGPLLHRAVPDVSLDADPESGYDVVVGGTVEAVGGTSASAPSWQGIWARAEGAHSGSLGFAGPVLYTTEPAAAFHDITLGSNGLYPAGPGYDLVTGRGTPDITALVGGA